MHSFFSSLLMFHIVCGSLMHNYSGLSLRFQVALIVAGGNPRPPALNDSPDILILLRIFSIISVIILKKKTSSQVLSYISYVPPPPPHREGFLHRFGLKTGIHFAHFALESGMAF